MDGTLSGALSGLLDGALSGALSGSLDGATQTGNLATHTVGEYYTSGVIAAMIAEGAPFTAPTVDPSRMHVLGTPSQLLDWSVGRPSAPAARICFDIDGTLLSAPSVPGDLSTCSPLAENVAACRALFEQVRSRMAYCTQRMHAAHARMQRMHTRTLPPQSTHRGRWLAVRASSRATRSSCRRSAA